PSPYTLSLHDALPIFPPGLMMTPLLLALLLLPRDAEQALDKMRDEIARVRKVADKAKDEKDIVKLDCAREKLQLVEGLLKVTEEDRKSTRLNSSHRTI